MNTITQVGGIGIAEMILSEACTSAVLLQSQINEMAEVGLSQESELNKKDEHAHNLYYENANLQTLVEEKDNRIEELESALKKINENLDLHDCESCWQHYFEIEKVIPEVQRGEHEA